MLVRRLFFAILFLMGAAAYSAKDSYAKLVIVPSDLYGEACGPLLAALADGNIMKFIYVGQGAQIWSQFTGTSVSSHYDKTALVRKLISDLLPQYFPGGASLIDIGAGDGTLGLDLLKLWSSPNVHYMAVDISDTSLSMVKTRFETDSPQTIFSSVLVDLDVANFRKSAEALEARTMKPSLHLLLGNTLGNAPDRPQFLRNVAASMSHDSMLMVGVHFQNDALINQTLTRYQSEESKALDEAVLTAVGLIPGSTGELRYYWDPSARDFRGVFTVRRDVSVWSEHPSASGGKPVHLAAGSEIEILRSHRFQLSELPDLFSSAGLEILRTEVDRNYIVTVARLKRSAE